MKQSVGLKSIVLGAVILLFPTLARANLVVLDGSDALKPAEHVSGDTLQLTLTKQGAEIAKVTLPVNPEWVSSVKTEKLKINGKEWTAEMHSYRQGNDDLISLSLTPNDEGSSNSISFRKRIKSLPEEGLTEKLAQSIQVNVLALNWASRETQVEDD